VFVRSLYRRYIDYRFRTWPYEITPMTYADFGKARFAPPGRCIYCGELDPPEGLRDEHIIPLALGGRTVLPKASCKKCEGITHAFEGQTAYHYFDAVRWQNEMPTRRPKSERPTSLPAIVGSAEIKTNLALPDHPSLGYLLDLANPGIFRGVEPTDVFKDVTVHAFVAVPNLAERIARLPDGGITYSGKLPVGAFFRTLAKIAHALAVGERGIDRFLPFLPDYILTGNGPAAHFIGGTYGAGGVPRSEAMLHRLGTEIVSHDGRQLVVARIRLFAYAEDTLVYTVVVGEAVGQPQRDLDQSTKFAISLPQAFPPEAKGPSPVLSQPLS
jgi:HNH endonuclease